MRHGDASGNQAAIRGDFRRDRPSGRPGRHCSLIRRQQAKDMEYCARHNPGGGGGWIRNLQKNISNIGWSLGSRARQQPERRVSMRANRMVFLALSLTSVILSGSVSAASASVGNVASEQTGQIHFSGKVVDTDGSPIEGARVRLYELINAGTVYSRGSKLAGDIATGADGRFSFAAPVKSGQYRYSYIVVEKGQLALGLANWRMTEDEEVEIKLGPAKDLTGVVVDSMGKPIPGVRTSVSMLQVGDAEERRALGSPVSQELLTVITDAEGSFSFDRIPAEATAEFLIRKDGRATIGTFQRSAYSSKGYQYHAGQKDIKLVLPTASRIEGIVVEKSTTRPVTQAKVLVVDQQNRPLPGIESTVSDDNGVFIFDALPPGDHLIKYMAPDEEPADWIAEPASVATEAGRTATNVKVELTKGAILEVLVADGETKKPIEGVSVSVYDQRRRESRSATTGAEVRIWLRQTMWSSTMSRETVDADVSGDFELKAIPTEHNYELRVSAEGYGVKRIEIHADDAVDNLLVVEPTVLPPANLSVSGVVVDVEGNPVPKARIDSYGFDKGQPDRLVTQTDARGRFTLEGVCEGKVNLSVDAGYKGKRLSARAITDGGASGIRIVAREGRAVVQHLSTKTYEEILRGNEKAITGLAVDESGSPVAGVPVAVRCHKKKREDGKYWWTFSSYLDLKATTDKQGRFAIPTEEDGEYNLLFSPDNHAAIIAYDIPIGKKDLKIMLPTGGTVTGSLMRMDKGKKVPIPNSEVKIEQIDRASYTHLWFDRDRTTLTDAEGKFRFEHVRTKIRPSGSRSEKQWTHIPRVWEISYGETSRTIEFDDNTKLLD
ncbi:MAG TPA: hypothetical protein ENI81_13055, partial [Phycisphaerales bacterium]|nr:hypothetical protein [Phycisphaerales bacterium]